MSEAKSDSRVAICVGGATQESEIRLEYSSFSDTRGRVLIVTGKPDTLADQCKKLILPIPIKEVLSARLVSNITWNKLQAGITLTTDRDKNFDLNTSELEPLIDTESPKSKPFSPQESHSNQQMLATWLWEPEIWQNPPPGLWDQLEDAAIQRIYVSIPIDPDLNLPVNMNTLKAFISNAHANGIQVWAVEGDPHAILASERSKYVRRAKAYSAYNRLASPQEKLAGVQYDIEPYLLPGFELEPDSGYRAYIDTITQIKSHLEIPINIVLPFWITEVKIEEQFLLERLTITDELTVMDYRTNPDLIEKLAEPFLEWGNRHGKPIHVALEAGPLPHQAQAVYHPAKRGELWHVNLDGQHLLLLLKHPKVNPIGESFLLSHKKKLDSNRLTFDKDIRKLISLIPSLHQRLGKWASYQGLSLHQYLEISRDKTSRQSD